MTTASVEAALIALFQYLGINKAHIVAGQLVSTDWLSFTARHPERIASLTLVSPGSTLVRRMVGMAHLPRCGAVRRGPANCAHSCRSDSGAGTAPHAPKLTSQTVSNSGRLGRNRSSPNTMQAISYTI